MKTFTHTNNTLTIITDGETASASELIDLLVHERAVSDEQLTHLAWSLLGYAAARDDRLQPAIEAADAAMR